jgi:hypothetical protein
MRAFFATILLLIILNSCNQKGSLRESECENLTGIDDSLYSLIISYQKINSIPVIAKYDVNLPPPPQTAFKYIYEVLFEKEEDTLITIYLRPDGIDSYQAGVNNKIYGVYQDSCLKPTYFISDSNLVKNFIKSYKTVKLHNFQYDNNSNIDFRYDRYVYKVINGKIVFKGKIEGNIKK